MLKILNEYLNKDCIITVTGAGTAMGTGGVKQVSGKIIEIDENYIKFQANKSTIGAVEKDKIAIINQNYIVAING